MLSVLALRLAAVNALYGYTIAGSDVYDSRQDADDGMDPEDEKFILCVYTETVAEKTYGTGTSLPGDVHAHLVIEAILVTKGAIPITGPDGSQTDTTALGIVVTDKVREAMVDFLCGQVRRRLFGVDTDAAATLFQGATMGIRDAESLPERVPDQGARIAARTLRYTVKIKADCWPSPGQALGEGLAALPQPLARVAAGLTRASDVALVTKLAALVAAPSTVIPLNLIMLFSDLGPTPPASADDAEMTSQITLS